MRSANSFISMMSFLCLLLCVASKHVLAEEVVSCKNQKLLSKAEGQALQLKLQATYRSVHSIKAEFLQSSYLAALEVSETSSGNVAFAQPAQMRWDYREPEPQVFLFADSTIWFYQKSQNQVLIDSANQVLLSDLPLAFLMGLGDVARDFSVLAACRRPEGLVLDLEPKKEGAQSKTVDEGERGLKAFQILVEAERTLPIGARVVDLNGNITTVLLRNMSINEQLASTLFVAEFPKGTDIQDRRKGQEE
jgi:outer membrane lipoprotein carrier protein